MIVAQYKCNRILVPTVAFSFGKQKATPLMMDSVLQYGCEISCKYIAISTVPSFKYLFLWIFPVKKIQNHKGIFSLGYLCF